MIDYMFSLATRSINGWFDLLAPVTSLTTLTAMLLFSSAVSLFLILRYEYKNHGRMWMIDGVEIVIAGICGLFGTVVVYGVPIVLMCIVGILLVMGIMRIFQTMVIISVDGVGRG